MSTHDKSIRDLRAVKSVYPKPYVTQHSFDQCVVESAYFLFLLITVCRFGASEGKIDDQI